MKKSLLSVVLAAGMAMSLLAGCGTSGAAVIDDPNQELEAVVIDPEEGTVEGVFSSEEETEAPAEEAAPDEGRIFVVGFDAEYPPYGYMDDNGEYTGYDLELAQEVCDRLGWHLVKQPIDWDAKDQELNSGAIDCIWNGFTMTGREDSYTFSVPYVDNSIVFVVMGDSDIQTKADLAGKIVVVQMDSSAETALKSEEDNDENLALAATFAELQTIPDYNTAFLNLEAGAVDCIGVDIGVARYQLASRGDTFRMLEEPLSTEQYGIGFKLGNEELRDTVQATLFEMYKDGTFDEITARYADQDLPDMVCLGQYVD